MARDDDKGRLLSDARRNLYLATVFLEVLEKSDALMPTDECRAALNALDDYIREEERLRPLTSLAAALPGEAPE